MKTKVIEITYSDKPNTISGGRINRNIIDWDVYELEQWRRHNPEAFQSLVQTTITPRIGKLIIIGTNPDESANYLKDLFINEQS